MKYLWDRYAFVNRETRPRRGSQKYNQRCCGQEVVHASRVVSGMVAMRALDVLTLSTQ
jgi:hypothetical protein